MPHLPGTLIYFAKGHLWSEAFAPALFSRGFAPLESQLTSDPGFHKALGPSAHVSKPPGKTDSSLRFALRLDFVWVVISSCLELVPVEGGKGKEQTKRHTRLGFLPKVGTGAQGGTNPSIGSCAQVLRVKEGYRPQRPALNGLGGHHFAAAVNARAPV